MGTYHIWIDLMWWLSIQANVKFACSYLLCQSVQHVYTQTSLSWWFADYSFINKTRRFIILMPQIPTANTYLRKPIENVKKKSHTQSAKKMRSKEQEKRMKHEKAKYIHAIYFDDILFSRWANALPFRSFFYRWSSQFLYFGFFFHSFSFCSTETWKSFAILFSPCVWGVYPWIFERNFAWINDAWQKKKNIENKMKTLLKMNHNCERTICEWYGCLSVQFCYLCRYMRFNFLLSIVVHKEYTVSFDHPALTSFEIKLYFLNDKKMLLLALHANINDMMSVTMLLGST